MKANVKIAVILQFYNLEKEVMIRIVINNDAQKRRETSSALS
jgi:hypothetical protein